VVRTWPPGTGRRDGRRRCAEVLDIRAGCVASSRRRWGMRRELWDPSTASDCWVRRFSRRQPGLGRGGHVRLASVRLPLGLLRRNEPGRRRCLGSTAWRCRGPTAAPGGPGGLLDLPVTWGYPAGPSSGVVLACRWAGGVARLVGGVGGGLLGPLVGLGVSPAGRWLGGSLFGRPVGGWAAACSARRWAGWQSARPGSGLDGGLLSPPVSGGRIVVGPMSADRSWGIASGGLRWVGDWLGCGW
jgi:hypothetical protein